MSFHPPTALALCAALLAAAPAALAQQSATSSWHVGAAGGLTRSNSACEGATSCDKSGAGLRVSAGWVGASGFGFEVVGHHLQGTRATVRDNGADTRVETDLQGIGIGGVFEYREGPWSFHGRLGLGYYRSTADASDNLGNAGSLSDNATQPYLSLGMGYRFAPGWTAILAVDALNSKHREADYKYDLVLWSLGVQRQF